MVTLLLSPAATGAYGAEIAAGVGAVEEGDDRMRPVAVVHAALNEIYAGRLYYYGREFGPVKEETFLISAVRRWGLFKSPALRASFGLALMDERATLDFDGADSGYAKTEDNFNIGGVFGVSWGIPKGPLYLSVSWDSHVFPAGPGGILLASGRKQTISLAMGMAIR